MRWARLARDDVIESWRDRSLWALLVLFVLVGALSGWLLGESAKSGLTGDLTFPLLIILLMGVLVPLVGVGITYDSVVGKRAVGSLHLLLGLPYLRRDVAFGTYVGRWVLTMVGVLVGVAVSGLVAALIAGGRAMPDPLDLLIALGLVALLAVAFVGIGLAFSMVTRSSTIAATGAFLSVVAFVFLWASVLVQSLVFLANQLGIAGSDPWWPTLLNAINPYHAYQALAATQFIDVGGMGTVLTSGETLYQTPIFAAGVIVFWAVVIPGLSYLSFQKADL